MSQNTGPNLPNPDNNPEMNTQFSPPAWAMALRHEFDARAIGRLEARALGQTWELNAPEAPSPDLLQGGDPYHDPEMIAEAADMEAILNEQCTVQQLIDIRMQRRQERFVQKIENSFNDEEKEGFTKRGITTQHIVAGLGGSYEPLRQMVDRIMMATLENELNVARDIAEENTIPLETVYLDSYFHGPLIGRTLSPDSIMQMTIACIRAIDAYDTLSPKSAAIAHLRASDPEIFSEETVGSEAVLAAEDRRERKETKLLLMARMSAMTRHYFGDDAPVDPSVFNELAELVRADVLNDTGAPPQE